ncbi:transcriptional regulator, partial [Enterococcus faecium]
SGGQEPESRMIEPVLLQSFK